MHLAEVAGMADQAVLLGLGGSERRKPHDLLRVRRDCVLKPWPVAPFAAGTLGRQLAGRDGIEVGIAAKGIGEVRMAAPADLASNELLLGGRLPLGAEGSGPKRDEPTKRCTGRKPLHASRSQREAHAGVPDHTTPGIARRRPKLRG